MTAVSDPRDFIPPPQQAIALPAPELAVRLLAWFVALEDAQPIHQPSQIHPGNILNHGTWPHHATDAFLRAVAEAWAWLEANALVAATPGTGGGWSFVTRAGRVLARRPNGLAHLQAEQRLGLELHPRIAGKVQSQFLLGESETAVFVAMKEVEIRVRELGRFPDSLIGVKLMQEAFKPDSGPLADPQLERGEQVGRMQLFAGAMGVFKNPTSHRPVNYADPSAAAEAVLLADLLLRMLDDITPRLPES
jgi:uncharacterized protein (TIGR02391 family)